MFPRRGRRPMSPYSPPRYQRRRMQGAQVPTNPNILSMFQDKDGKFDVNRVFTSIHQMENAYKQVSPFITKFMKR